ncbi:MAG: GntR family transcriptional regulator [Lachnospiraceae bacterium]
MIITLDMKSATPIYVQLRNQIVLGIGNGSLKLGEQLPTVRQLASEIGVNNMTVSKAYGILKQEGFIETDRRNGAKIAISSKLLHQGYFEEKIEDELKLLITEAKLCGCSNAEILEHCRSLISGIEIEHVQEVFV